MTRLSEEEQKYFWKRERLRTLLINKYVDFISNYMDLKGLIINKDKYREKLAKSGNELLIIMNEITEKFAKTSLIQKDKDF